MLVEQELRRKEMDDRAFFVAQKEEIQRLHNEIETVRVLIRGKDRHAGDIEGEFNSRVNYMEGQHAMQVRELEGIVELLKKGAKN